MKNAIVLLFFLFVCYVSVAGPGKLLAVGGGSEQDIAAGPNGPGGWSTPAYRWAVDKSANKRVAIVGTGSNPSTFLRNYFTGQCGAVFAKDFVVSTAAQANAQTLYDSLITYDVIFFRGGDQSQYYNLYRGRRLAQAVDSVYRRGGVIAGTSAGLHILSTIVYAALNNSSSGYTSLRNINTSDITLRNDFFNFFPGYVFDSHVTERGRLPRTVAFLGRWFLDSTQKIGALAVDDLTAIGIDENNIGEVFGTGTVGVYRTIAKSNTPFTAMTGKLAGDSIKITHLLNTWKYDFTTHTIVKPTVSGTYNVANPTTKTLNTPITVLMSGKNSLSDNTSILGHLVNETGEVSDTIYIITGADSTLANGAVAIKAALTAAGANAIYIVPNNVAATNTFYPSKLEKAKKILFVNNTMAQLTPFVTASAAGLAMRSRFTVPGVVLAFWGGDSRFAGRTALAENYLTAQAYLGQLSSTRGLGVLPNTFIVPFGMTNNATGADLRMENTSSAVTYFAMRDTASYSLLIPGNTVAGSGFSFVKYYAEPETGDTYFTSYGAVSALVFQNNGNQYAFSNTTSMGNGSQTPRQVAGFDSLYLHLVDDRKPLKVGKYMVPVATPTKIHIAEVVKKDSLFKDSLFTIKIDFKDDDGFVQALVNSVVISVTSNIRGGQLYGNTTFLGLAGQRSITLSGIRFSAAFVGVTITVSAQNLTPAVTYPLQFRAASVTSAIEHHTNTDFCLYPNPANDKLHISGTEGIIKAEVVDLIGNCVKVEIKGNELDISALLPGVYVLKLSDNNGTVYKKFIKK